MVWKWNYIHTRQTPEEQTSTLSCVHHFLAFVVVVVFVADWRRHRSSRALLYGAFLRTEREGRTSQLTVNQPLMDNIPNRLKWFVCCIFFWHYFFWSVNSTCTWLAAKQPQKPTTPTHFKLCCPVQVLFGFWAFLVLMSDPNSTSPCT